MCGGHICYYSTMVQANLTSAASGGSISAVCGLDEVGRGPLAGPVVAAAVLLKHGQTIEGVDDSKRLSEAQRLALVEPIRSGALGWGIGWVWQQEVDDLNIHHASLLAMERAMEQVLDQLPGNMAGYEPVDKVIDEIIDKIIDEIIVDGRFVPGFKTSRYQDLLATCKKSAIVKADSKIPAVSAASILAKVERDSWMIEYDKKEPLYGFAQHKGYPTPAHKAAIRRHGPSAIQRLSFNY